MRFELRCPVHRVRLFAVLHGDHPTGTVDRSANLIEIACPNCRDDARRSGERTALVLHRFNLLGDCVETIRR